MRTESAFVSRFLMLRDRCTAFCADSIPRQGRQFEYLFYLDFSGNVRSENVIELVSQLSEEMPEFSFLGNYAEPEFPIK